MTSLKTHTHSGYSIRPKCQGSALPWDRKQSMHQSQRQGSTWKRMEAAAPRCKMQAASCCEVLQAKVPCDAAQPRRRRQRCRSSKTRFRHTTPQCWPQCMQPPCLVSPHPYVCNVHVSTQGCAAIPTDSSPCVCHMKQNLYRHRLHPLHPIHPSIHPPRKIPLSALSNPPTNKQ
jgi:hypothetical protein